MSDVIQGAIAKAEFPEKLSILFEQARYKVLYGGRGGAKSWGVARALLILGAKSPLRLLCAREFQTSIKDSVHKLLSDQIYALGLETFYEITQANIKGKNGTEFSFVGLKNNTTNIKSYEGVDICWVEEAQSVSKNSWNILIPTIRKENSEIWITFNPELETDETYQRFVVHAPENSIVQKINWSDNPWFPETLNLERLALKQRDVEAYNTVWEGLCRQTIDGAIFICIDDLEYWSRQDEKHGISFLVHEAFHILQKGKLKDYFENLYANWGFVKKDIKDKLMELKSKRLLDGKRVGNTIQTKRNVENAMAAPAPHLPNDGKANMRSTSPMSLDKHRIDQMSRLRTPWK